ncbi:hypothetical protein A6J80_12990 [Paracoccus yeei]|uniref:TfoX N-terminal domain-containing protein n=2 Tax=Paracoccus yeei TaxID=147645 RepID=A0A1V0GTK2_9RHOB|nr:hypothetical protein A6J80_12990 [Paracoccus yeei]
MPSASSPLLLQRPRRPNPLRPLRAALRRPATKGFLPAPLGAREPTATIRGRWAFSPSAPLPATRAAQGAPTACDARLEGAMRRDLGALPGLTERPMFGGLCFLLNRHMLCAIRQEGAMVRVGPARQAQVLAMTDPAPMIHQGRPSAGWVWLAGGSLSDDKTRARLTARAPETVRALPPKE